MLGGFEGFEVEMRPQAVRLARRMQLPVSPLFTEEDMLQEALVALFRAWKFYKDTHTGDELCALGYQAMARELWRLRRDYYRATERAALDVALVNYQATREPAAVENHWDALPGADAELVYWRILLQQISRTLGEVERQALGELLAPSVEMLKLLQSVDPQRQSVSEWKEAARIRFGLRSTRQARELLSRVRRSVRLILEGGEDSQ